MFEETGSVSPTPPKRKSPIKKREDAKNELETMVTEFPNLSLRKAASAIGVSPTLVYHVLHDDLHWKPYTLHRWHKLEPHVYKQRVKFTQWFLIKFPEIKEFLICIDEAYFTLTLPVNKQNNRIWGRSSPYNGIEVPLNDKEILVWCAIYEKFIFGPYFFSG